ncbi:MAG: hypothetical protein GXO37_02820 [Chloroflexi bacterium]|nr:hypothetical protein [Chloroflexota bacterium]
MSTQTQAKDQPTLVITERDKFWMNCKLYQLWRFIVLNIKILKAVDQSKRS